VLASRGALRQRETRVGQQLVIALRDLSPPGDVRVEMPELLAQDGGVQLVEPRVVAVLLRVA